MERICKIEEMSDRTTPENITRVASWEVFVFGSNRIGRHGKGAAKTALKWGAQMGQGEGPQGRTYGIPTKGHDMRVSLPLHEIKVHVDRFIRYAAENPSEVFLVTEVGCGLAGYTPKDIAPLFAGAIPLSNIHLPVRFWRRLKDELRKQ